MSHYNAAPPRPIAPPAAAVPAVDAYRAYVLALIWVVLLLRFIDLQIISVLLESIKKEFAVSDTQLGLLTGFAFSVLYGLLGVPVAWLADRSNRSNIITVALALWSLMTALCGLATSFATLFLARVGVGVGEAGGTAPAYSLISDYFSAKRRATVFAILNSAVPVGVFAGFLVGGVVSTHFGWRAAFVAVGLPGILLALLVRLTLREPTRGRLEKSGAVVTAVPLSDALRHLLKVRSYRHFVLGSSIFTMGAMGSGIWIASFFVRVHGMPIGEVATWLAWIYGAGGLAGALLGGMLADRLVDRTGDRRWYAWLPAISTFSILPFAFFVYLWPHPTQALLAHIGTTFLMHFWMGPLYGTVQGLAGVKRRAMAAAINMLAVNLIAYAMGPLLVGLASDFFSARLGNESLRYSILSVVVAAYAWAGLHFLLAGRTLHQDLHGAETEDLHKAG
jgi:MFS family permease